MKDFLAGVSKLEADLKANDNAAADADLKNLNSQEKDGHKAYRRPEKE
jgi:cytochrome c556